MSRLPTLHTPALADLEAQLRFAPKQAILRDIERIEALAPDIEPNSAYPIEWIVFRVTGYRQDAKGPAIRGRALLADLSALAERLCASARISPGDVAPDTFLTLDDLATRWSVSRSTINRRRSAGLIARRVQEATGITRLVCALSVVEAHETSHARTLARARGYSRIDKDMETRMIRRAERYARSGLSLNEAASRIGARYGRSHEGVRQVLQRHDRRARRPLFAAHGPISRKERRFIERASARALEPADIATRLGRSTDAVRRCIDASRAAVLDAIDRSGAMEAPETSARWRDREELLDTSAARTNLHHAPPSDTLVFIQWACDLPPADDAETAARIAAYHVLRARAARTIRSTQPLTASAIDLAETRIRWATLLKVAIVSISCGTVLDAIATGAGRPADRLRPHDAAAAIHAAMRAAGSVIDAHDPDSAGPLGAPLALGVATRVRRLGLPHEDARRASPRVISGVSLRPWVETIAPRFAPLAPDPRIMRARVSLSDDDRTLLDERFGLAGEPPSTIEEMAHRRAVRPMHLARPLRRAIRAALHAPQ